MTDSWRHLDEATLRQWDETYVWHPFTPHSVYAEESPLMIVAGEGNYLIDVNGKRYLDGVSSIWCNAFGHRRQEIDAAIREQLDHIAHSTFLGHASAPGVVLAKRLIEHSPDGLDKVFFSDNGSTASEIALKMAYQYFQQNEQPERRKFLALTNAYNGDTLGAVSVGGIDLFHAKFRDLLFETVRGPSPYCYRCPLGKNRESCNVACLNELIALIEANADTLAGVIMEPGMQGAGGMIVYPPGFLKRVREVTKAHGIFLILDEVAVGMGRSGKMFACEQEEVVPDFLCIAKMLTNGYVPLAATLTTQAVFDGFLGRPELGRTFYHGHTFTGNAIGAVAALGVLDIFERDNILAQLPEKVAYFQEALARFWSYDVVGDVRQFGLGAGIELVQSRQEKTPWPPEQRRGYNVCLHAREHGVFARPLGDVLVMMPPLSITYEEIDTLVGALAHGIEKEFGL